MKALLSFFYFTLFLFGNQASIDEISIKIYDNNLNKIVTKPTNIYGNNMDLFLAVKVSQKNDNENFYTIKVKAFGKGRENDAEGLVEDYKINLTKKIILNSKEGKYVPFILEYPCTKEEQFEISITDKHDNTTSKKLLNKLTFCYLN